ncbi:Competence protein ComEC [Entamoeba marina]
MNILAPLILLVLGCYGFDESKLNIFVFHVGQADSQLILFPSGYSVLIDLGENRDDFTPTNVEYVSQRLTEILPTKTIDVLVLTHTHLDHFGYVEKNGIWYLIEQMNFTVNKFVSRMIGEYTGEKREDCTNETIDWIYVGEYESYNVDWICYANSRKDLTKLSRVQEFPSLCSTSQIQPPDDHAEIQIVMHDAYSVKRGDGSLVADNWRDTVDPPSENDYSICLRIQYGDFVYYTGGDADGDHAFIWGYETNNVETKMKDIIGSVDVLRANHHGDSLSNSYEFVSVLNPTVSVISCGDHNHYGLPYQQAANVLSLLSDHVYMTENCNPYTTDHLNNFFAMQDDVIITVVDDEYFTISSGDESFVHTYNIKQHKPSRKVCNYDSNQGCGYVILFLLLSIITLL